MRFSFKIFLAFFLVIGIGAYLFFSTFMSELKPAFRQASEESLVDIANLLAEIASTEINNAISFSPANANIIITVTTLVHKVAICIEDEGAGIPEYAAAHIFDRFYS